MIDSAREGYIDEEGVEKYKLVDEKRGLIKESAGEVAVEKAVGKIQAIVRGRQTRKLTKAKAKKEIEKLASETSKSFVNNIFSQVLGNVEIPPDTSATELLQEYLGEASLAELPEEEISLDDEMRIDIERRVNDFVAELDKEIAGIINPETGRNLTYKEKLSKKTKALINVLKKLKHPNPSTLTNEEKIAEIKKLQFNRLKAMNPLDRSTRKLMRPDGFEGMKTGLGVVSKLKKHFKGDEKLLKKVLSALQDDSSSDEEENKELARHIKATDSIDKKIEKLVKGGDAQFLPKAQRDAFYSGMKKIGLGRGNLDANTFKFLGNKDKWHEAFSGVGFKATRIPVSKVGKGVKLENQENPTYRQFGKYVLHIPHLVNNNTANFKYPSLGSIPSIKPLTVSDDYKDLILDVLQTGKLNKKELERLPQSEIKHFERVAVGAGLVEQLGLKLGSTEEDKADSKRFELLRGEYLAGNNNQDLIKELRMLITKFINTGRIHKNEGLNLLLELSTL
jgi:hypothetical protein